MWIALGKSVLLPTLGLGVAGAALQHIPKIQSAENGGGGDIGDTHSGRGGRLRGWCSGDDAATLQE
jgi:hypothetical protein